MPLNITPTAPHAPGYCSASGSLAGPFLQTGTAVRGVRVQISLPWLLGIAPELGLVPATELRDALTALDETLAIASALQTRVERFDEDVANVSDAMVAFLAETRARGALLDELKAAREAIDTLAERVADLEGASGAQGQEG